MTPDAATKFLLGLAQDIAEVGFQIISVDDDPMFAYTVGRCLEDKPELFVFGNFDPRDVAYVINLIADKDIDLTDGMEIELGGKFNVRAFFPDQDAVKSNFSASTNALFGRDGYEIWQIVFPTPTARCRARTAASTRPTTASCARRPLTRRSSRSKKGEARSVCTVPGLEREAIAAHLHCTSILPTADVQRNRLSSPMCADEVAASSQSKPRHPLGELCRRSHGGLPSPRMVPRPDGKRTQRPPVRPGHIRRGRLAPSIGQVRYAAEEAAGLQPRPCSQGRIAESGLLSQPKRLTMNENTDDQAPDWAEISREGLVAHLLGAHERLFADDPKASLMQMFAIIGGEENQVIACPWGSEEQRSMVLDALQAILASSGASRYAFWSEVWVSKREADDESPPVRPMDGPNRLEKIMTLVVDKGEPATVVTQTIVRNESGDVVRLETDDGEFVAGIDGALTNLFPEKSPTIN